MIRKYLGLAQILCAMLCATDRASIRVQVLADPGMQPIPDASIELIERGTRMKVGVTFREEFATDVPYGDYILRVTRPGFRNYEQPLRVLQPSVSLRVGLTVSNTPHCGLTGKVDPVRSDMWVKIVPILNKETVIDTKVAANGDFEVAGLSAGDSAVLVIQERKIVAIRQVVACADKRLSISWAPQ